MTLGFESVYDTVFYQRLNGQLRQVAAEQLVVLHIDGVLQLFLKAFLLQGEIVFYRIQFLLQVIICLPWLTTLARSSCARFCTVVQMAG